LKVAWSTFVKASPVDDVMVPVAVVAPARTKTRSRSPVDGVKLPDAYEVALLVDAVVMACVTVAKTHSRLLRLRTWLLPEVAIRHSSQVI
jgi:hypothetical protein